jgi:hypothetical protein
VYDFASRVVEVLLGYPLPLMTSLSRSHSLATPWERSQDRSSSSFRAQIVKPGVGGIGMMFGFPIEALRD